MKYLEKEGGKFEQYVKASKSHVKIKEQYKGKEKYISRGSKIKIKYRWLSTPRVSYWEQHF